MKKPAVLMASCLAFFSIILPASAQSAGAGGGACAGGYTVTARQASGQTYDPIESTRAILRINLQPNATDIPQGCTSLPVTITPQSSSTFAFTNGGNTIGFTQINSNLVSQANVTRFELNGNARGQLVRGNAIDVDLFEITAGQFLAAGEYQGSVLVQVGDGLPTPVLFTITVQPAIKFVIENGSLNKELSFGEVTNGASVRSIVFYQSNAAVLITIQSQNQGAMVHESGRAFGTIPYSMTYDGAPVNLATAAQITKPFSGLGTRREQLLLRVEPQRERFAGNYRDVLTLNYTAF